MLEYPTSVENLHQKDGNDQTYPTESIIRYEFPRRGNFEAMQLTWYDGLLKPKQPAGVREDLGLLEEKNGTMFVGDRGLIVMKGRAQENVLAIDGKIVRDYAKPQQILPRLPNIPSRDEEEKQDADRMHKLDWILSCKTGAASGSNFDHAGPLTEWVQIGNIALQFSKQKLEYDGPRMRFTNCPEANRYLTKHYRKGWELT